MPQLAVVAGIGGVIALTLAFARIARGPDVDRRDSSEEPGKGSKPKAA